MSDHYEWQDIEGFFKVYEMIEKAVKEFKPNVIVHFAAESHVDNSISNPQNFAVGFVYLVSRLELVLVLVLPLRLPRAGLRLLSHGKVD